MNTRSQPTNSILKAAAALLIPVEIFLLNYAHRIDADEGAVLAGAWNLFQGKTLYVDFFQCQAPLSFYYNYLAFSLLGPHYSSALFASMLLFLIASAFFGMLVYGLTRHYLASLLTVLLWVLVASLSYPLINYNSYASFLSIIFAWLFIFRKNRFFLTAAAGATATTTFYFLQHRGAVLIAMALFILGSSSDERRKTHILAFFSGSFIAALYPLFIWKSKVISVLFEIGGGYLGTATRQPGGALSLLVLTVLSVVLLKRYGLLIREVKELILLQTALFVSVLTQFDIAHLGTVLFPLLTMLALIVLHALRSLPSRRSMLFSSVVCFSCLAVITTHYVGENRELSASNERLLGQLNDRVRGKSIYAFPMLPNLYFELQKSNPYFNHTLIENMFPVKLFERNLEILAVEQPDIVVTNYDFVEKYGFSKKNVIDMHIRSQYAYSDTIGPFDLWNRKGPPRYHAKR